MPTDAEQKLLELLRIERARNASSVKTASTLPDLSLEMVMSDSALREIRAAQGVVGYAVPFSQRQESPANLRGRTANVAWADDASNWEEPATQALPDLESIFMQQAMTETGGGVYEGHQSRAADTTYDDFSFDTTGLTEGTTSPNEAVRFRIGRDSPRSTPFSRNTSQNDGVVVSQRNGSGWQAARAEASRPVLSRSEAVARSESRTQTSTPRQAASAPEPYRPTVFDRLTSNRSIID